MMDLKDKLTTLLLRKYGSTDALWLMTEVIPVIEQHFAADRNKLSEMLMDRTDALQRLQRLVGEEA